MNTTVMLQPGQLGGVVIIAIGELREITFNYGGYAGGSNHSVTMTPEDIIRNIGFGHEAPKGYKSQGVEIVCDIKFAEVLAITEDRTDKLTMSDSHYGVMIIVSSAYISHHLEFNGFMTGYESETMIGKKNVRIVSHGEVVYKKRG